MSILPDEEKIILQPRYVEEFQCNGHECNAHCCQKWRINIDSHTYKKYQRIKNPDIRKKIISSIEPDDMISGNMLIKLNSEGICPLLDADKLCYIQRNLGEDMLSFTCQEYPRTVRHINGCQIRILSMTCPVAAKHALFSEHGMDIEQVLSPSDDNAWKIASVSNNLNESIDTRVVANVVLGGLSILQNANYTREQRMIILGIFLDAVDDYKSLPDGADAIFNLALSYNNNEKFSKQIKTVFDNWNFYSTAHNQLLTGVLSTLHLKGKFKFALPLIDQVRHYAQNYDKFHSVAEKEFKNVIDNYWQQEFLYHGFPFCLNGSFMHNYFAYLMAYKIWEMYLFNHLSAHNCTVSNDEILQLITTYSRELDHIDKFVEHLVDHILPFETQPIKLMQVMLRLK